MLRLVIIYYKKFLIMNYRFSKLLLFTLCLTQVFVLEAQYFGKNKPRYRSFDFNVFQTPHFEIYSYLTDRSAVQRLGRWSETWYDLHQEVLKDTFDQLNPILFYNDHADFQQTNAIQGAIGVGTGGVTEAFKNRVIMPLTHTNQQTNHVLGHEMVHAFQYNMIIHGDSTNISNLQNLPLWMVEGLAEYMSIGRFDANTAMWMRDAVLNKKVPTLKDLSKPEFFPYRYGQAFWAFLTGYAGDDIIKPFFVMTAKYGINAACDSLLDVNYESLSRMFKSAIETYYEPLLGEKKENFYGKKLIDDKNGGELNISPSVSPNGRYLVFLSEKDLFGTDLFLADTKDGKIVRKIFSIVKDGHLDNLNFLESAGTWSPDSKKFAFIAFKKGRNTIIIKDIANGKTLEEITLKNIPAITNPSWSPDGKSIVFSGLVEGQSDLYLLDLRSKRVSRLTNDIYSEIHPSWSADGKRILFATDRISMDKGQFHGKWTMNIAELNVETKEVINFDLFYGADNLNPEYNHEGTIVFLSDRDGYRNIYTFDPETNKTLQLTKYKVGVSGITAYSPALSVSKSRDELLFSQYYDGKYTIYKASSKDFPAEEIDQQAIDYTASTLPIVGLQPQDMVNTNLEYMNTRNQGEISTKKVPYKPHFKLDYIGGSAGGGVGTSNSFGTRSALSGGVDLLFSDILGNNQLYTGLALNGEIYDVAGIFQYTNRKGRLAWGASLSHIPNLTGTYPTWIGEETLTDQLGNSILTQKVEQSLIRIFQDGVTVFAHYPFSVTQRLEASAGTTYNYFRRDVYTNYYDAYYWDLGFYRLVWQEREKVPIEGDLNLNGFIIRKDFLYNTGIAYVGDNSFFGLTAPLTGYRYRLSIDKYWGGYDFLSTLADFRKYQRFGQLTLAGRVTHFARYGADQSSFFPIFLGDMGFVHGYPYRKIDELNQRYNLDINNLFGSKLALSSLELRIPFSGPKRLSLIKSDFIPADLNFFLDGGVVWDDYSQFKDAEPPKLLMSAGASFRVNLFGALILEPYYAFPLQKNSKGVFGLNLVPGW